METTYRVIKKEITLESINDSIDIWFFGDVHRFTPSCDVSEWKDFLKRSKPEKNTYYIGMGDYNEFAASGERKIMKGDKVHETTREKFDYWAEKENRAFASEVKQMRGRLLGLVHGNHSWEFMNGKNSTEDLAERLQTEYLGWLCYFRLILKYASHRIACDMVLCHGKAGGKLKGTSINQVSDLKMIFPFANIFCMGHNHDKGVWPDSILYYDKDSGKIKQKVQMLCRSGSFKRAYNPDTSGYEIGRLLRPANLGAIKLTLRMKRDQSNGLDLLNLDIESTV